MKVNTSGSGLQGLLGHLAQISLRAPLLLLSSILVFSISIGTGCGTDPDSDGDLPLPDSNDTGSEDTVTDVETNEVAPDVEADAPSDTNEDVVDDLSETEDVEVSEDVEEDVHQDLGEDTNDDSSEISDIEEETETSEQCTTVCDCSDQVNNFCRRPPGLCFPVTQPEERQYCCTSDNCPTGRSCEFSNGELGLCP